MKSILLTVAVTFLCCSFDANVKASERDSLYMIEFVADRTVEGGCGGCMTYGRPPLPSTYCCTKGMRVVCESTDDDGGYYRSCRCRNDVSCPTRD